MKKSTFKLTSLVMAVTMSITLLATGRASTVSAYEGDELENSIREMLLKNTEGQINSGNNIAHPYSLEDENDNGNDGAVITIEKDPEEVVRIIVEIEGEPATLQYPEGEQPSAYSIEQVKEEQEPIIDEVQEKTGSEVKNTFGNLINGFSIEVQRKDIKEIEGIDGVISVKEANIYYPDMSTAKDFTEAVSVWEDYGYKGEGLVVSVIDTGIDPTHKDMVLTDSSTAKLNEENLNNIGYGKYYTEKVPYGYNFADENDDIVDTAGSMHGMHVAGIVAANGSDEEFAENKAIKGVAPEAQLLAMKVFSNGPESEYAYEDDIIAAIEASVELGADIINMSLGSSAGYRNDDEPEQKAIKNATDDGVICVVSAGNSATSLDPYVVEGVSDTGVVGSPGTASDALQVASSNNSMITLPAVTAVVNGEAHLMGYTQCDIDPIDVFTSDNNLQLVDCGFGNPADFDGKDLAGKVAFISRGDITFVEKQINAQAAGASAVIIYNNTANQAHINMATDPSITIPVIFITNEDATIIKSAASLDEVTVSFNKEVISMDNPVAGQMSDFTSWGPTPDLEFAPQITAPGGNIYSTLNNNKYGSMSGTSMASPHVAGATALIVEGLKNNGIELEGRELVEFVKQSIINTAEPLNEINAFGEEVPYSPRRQGSGMIQAKDAINNRVLAEGNDGQATISLKEIGNTTSFEITLTNYSDTAVEYEVKSLGDVLTAFTPSMAEDEVFQIMAFDTILSGAELSFDTTNITVEGNGQATVTATLNVPEGYVSNNFVEGFIRFEAVNEEAPSLVVPYMGYYGDWDAEKIIDGAIYDDENVTISPSFGAGLAGGEYSYLGYENGSINPDKYTISPNGDGDFDEFIPALYLLRNAKEISVDLLNANKEVIAENIADESYLTKNILNDENRSSVGIYDTLSWNGLINNEVAVEGQYYLNYKAKVDGENSEYQSFIMPVKVDTTAIKTNLLSATSIRSSEYTLEVEFGGELENGNLNNFIVLVNGEQLLDYTLEGDKLTSNLNLDKDKNQIIIATLDNAYNFGIDIYEVNKEIVVAKSTDLNKSDVTNNSVKLTWNGPEYAVGLVEYVIYKDGKEYTTVPYGTNEITIDGLKKNTIYGFKVTNRYSNGEESKPVSINVRTIK